MDLTSLTETELKSLAYDQVKNLNMAQNNLALIEQELAKRIKPEITDGE